MLAVIGFVSFNIILACIGVLLILREAWIDRTADREHRKTMDEIESRRIDRLLGKEAPCDGE